MTHGSPCNNKVWSGETIICLLPQDPVVTRAASATVSIVANLSRIQYCIKYLEAGYSTPGGQPAKVRYPISFSPPVKTGILPLPTCNDPGPEELSTGVESVTLDIESMTRPGADNAKLIWTEPYRSAHMAFMNNKTSMQVSCGAHMVPAQPGQVNTHTKPWDPSV